MFYLKSLFLVTAVTVFMSACAAPAVPTSQGVATPASFTPSPAERATIESPPDSSAAALAAAPTLAPDRTPTGTIEGTTATPSPTLDPKQACDDMIARGQPGLYVVSIQPFPDLIWDRVPRSFRVDLCDSTTVPTPLGSRFVVLVYFPGESRPRGQTSESTVRLPPGLDEITLGTWVPGLQNHISACVVQPPIELSVAYTYPPDLNVFHPIPYADGHDRKTFSVKCVGIFP